MLLVPNVAIRTARDALYRAKLNGRNRVEVASRPGKICCKKRLQRIGRLAQVTVPCGRYRRWITVWR
jgi:hypothetical protein